MMTLLVQILFHMHCLDRTALIIHLSHSRLGVLFKTERIIFLKMISLDRIIIIDVPDHAVVLHMRLV